MIVGVLYNILTEKMASEERIVLWSRRSAGITDTREGLKVCDSCHHCCVLASHHCVCCDVALRCVCVACAALRLRRVRCVWLRLAALVALWCWVSDKMV